MTDDPRREWLRQVLDNREDPAPADVVPHAPTMQERRDHLLALNEAADTWSEATIPGDVVEDVDGVPIGVEASETVTAYHGGGTVTPRQLEAAGLTAADVPNLQVLDPHQKENDHE